MWLAHNFRAGQLAIHYHKHGTEFGPISRKIYLQRARMLRPINAKTYLSNLRL